MAAPDFDIVMFPRDRWDGVWRRRHFLAREFAAMGRRVLFVEPPRWFRPGGRLDAVPKEVMERVFVFSPWKVAPHSVEIMRRADLAVAAAQAGGAARRLGLQRPVAWVTAEFAVHVADAVAPRCVVYDVTDDWTQADLGDVERGQIGRDDAAMLLRADMVFAVSRRLEELKAQRHPRVVWLPNGVRPELYERQYPWPQELSGVARPIAGYAGTLHRDRIDVGLVVEAARRGAGRFAFVFVGPNRLPPSATRELEACPNVKLIPEQPPEGLPAFVAAFDVCVIPHLVSPFTDSLDPIKLYEYLAAGKPVVSTGVQGVMPYREFVDVADDAEAFAAKIAAVPASGAPDAEARRHFGRENSWKARAESAMNRIGELLNNK